MDKLTYALNQLDNRRDTLADNLNQKGVSASRTETLETLVPKVLEIEGGGDSPGWEPNPQWWDIETMVETGVLEWNGESVDNVRAGFIVIDTQQTIKLAPNHEYYLSDGSYYNVGSTAVVHTWNRTYDKYCDLGYSTRAVIIVSENREINVSHREFATDSVASLYVYFGDCTPTIVFGTASSGNVTLQSVVFSQDTIITSFPSNCFCKCSSLQYITIPDEVTVIPSSCFYGCTSLQQITIPDNITTLSSQCFNGCTSLQRITLPDGLTTMSSSVFFGCTSLQQITIPEGMTSIGSSLFTNCSAVRYLNIKSTTIIIGTNMSPMTNLLGVTIPQNYSASLRIYSSNNISVSSLEKIIENYADRSGTTALTFTISTANLAKISQDYLDLAASKNITIATA